ncbi:hypothetical protein [Aeromicrobium duanguangcaii]|uniref:MFS transporter n=1 Tax=Aeromicrobium duanguangcaii TaxID=2968086 RepID=A0ABY5KD67_9ACTN|nr:hypothetical protein [Aeromicrobium duanguangcaii]MCL3837344.1 hypothetical protein [Aeromicrobium duanguangcaii]UUI67376.1 hypothetical protein NP095_09145 [Aeromicrobium duanguangcaii]
MSAPGAPFARLVRAAAVSLWATLMAVAAHVMGSGEAPSVVALVPVVAAGSALAWWAAARRIGFGWALVLLALPQLGVHLVSGYVHGHQVVPATPAMLAAHLAGLVVVAVGIDAAERLWWSWWARVSFVLRPVRLSRRPVSAPVPRRGAEPVLRTDLLDHALVRRGPPFSRVDLAPVAGACR